MNPMSGTYGAAMPGYAPMKQRGRGRSFNCMAVVVALTVPPFLYMVMSAVLSFSWQYNNPGICNMIKWVGLAFVLFLGYFAYAAWRRYSRGEDNPSWYVYLFVSCFVAWIWACASGSYNFGKNMQPYYDVMNLNTYPSVDPASYKGQQLMDAGRIIFTADSRLDLQKSMGFRNLDIYCVAPVVTGTDPMAAYDFWAVGKNCCSGHTADFACGEFNNPMAHSGLRLMTDADRPYFRLAVQQAEAAYNIKASHPVFLQWMQDPISEINAYQDDGFKTYLFGVFLFIALNCFFVVMMVIMFSKFA